MTLNDERLQVKTLLSEDGGLEPVRDNLGVLVLDELSGWDFENGVEFLEGETFRFGYPEIYHEQSDLA